MPPAHAIVPLKHIELCILLIPGQRVLLDSDLAGMYGVDTKNLTKAVTRNRSRFPPDFMFRLTRQEYERLRFQFGTSNPGRGGRRYPPYAFTEQGVAMLSSVLNSPRAVSVNIEIMRTFVRLRQVIAGNADLARKLRALEKKYDAKFRIVFDAIRALMEPDEEDDKPRSRIGFNSN